MAIVSVDFMLSLASVFHFVTVWSLLVGVFTEERKEAKDNINLSYKNIFHHFSSPESESFAFASSRL